MNHQRNATRDKGILRDHLAGMSMTVTDALKQAETSADA